MTGTAYTPWAEKLFTVLVDDLRRLHGDQSGGGKKFLRGAVSRLCYAISLDASVDFTFNDPGKVLLEANRRIDTRARWVRSARPTELEADGQADALDELERRLTKKGG